MLERPSIEFLATEKFGFMQTGSKVISGLVVNFRNTPIPTFQSNIIKSELFGQIMYMQSPGYVYVDSAGTEFTFSGASETLTSFTVGMYVYATSSRNAMWIQVSNHGFTKVPPYSVSDFRIHLHGVWDGSGMLNVVANSNGQGNVEGYRYYGGSDVQNGWVHVMTSFDATTGSMKIHFNGDAGVQIGTFTQSYGLTGAYVKTWFL